FLSHTQCVIRVPNTLRLAGVTKDGFVDGQGLTVMHQTDSAAQAPQRRSAKLVGSSLPAVLHDPVAGTDIVQSKIAERMNSLACKSSRHPKRSAVDSRIERRGYERWCVADITVKRIEQGFTSGNLNCRRQP